MPILDGLPTTREIHSRPESFFASHRRPAIVALTANAMKQEQQSCIDAGMDDYLSKPVSKQKLATVLQRWSRVSCQAKETIASDEAVFATDVDSGDSLIDWESLHQLSNGDTEFELELLEVFVANVAIHLEKTRVAIASKDFQKLEREAHHLKVLSGLKQKSTPNKAQSSFISDEYVSILVQPLDKTERHCCPKRL